MKTKLTILATFTTLAILFSLSIFASADTGSQWVTHGQTTNGGGVLVFAPTAHGTQFIFPNATAARPAFVNYLLDTYSASLTESNTMSMTFILTPTGSPSFLGDTFNGENLATPAFVRLFFQSNLPSSNTPSCVGSGSNVNNYWWSDDAYYTFPSSPSSLASSVTITLTSSLSSTTSHWSNICGGSAASNPAAFDLALANIKYIGLSFGSGYFFASGVGVDGSTGTAQFQLASYSVA